MRLIDADSIKYTYTQDLFDTLDDFERVNDIIDYASTVDAALIVRCKDCNGITIVGCIFVIDLAWIVRMILISFASTVNWRKINYGKDIMAKDSFVFRLLALL